MATTSAIVKNQERSGRRWTLGFSRKTRSPIEEKARDATPQVWHTSTPDVASLVLRVIQMFDGKKERGKQWKKDQRVSSHEISGRLLSRFWDLENSSSSERPHQCSTMWWMSILARSAKRISPTLRATLQIAASRMYKSSMNGRGERLSCAFQKTWKRSSRNLMYILEGRAKKLSALSI